MDGGSLLGLADLEGLNQECGCLYNLHFAWRLDWTKTWLFDLVHLVLASKGPWGAVYF